MGARVQIAVVGPGDATGAEGELATEVGRRLAEAGAVLVTGGSTGVMHAACVGARAAGGRTLGVLPGDRHQSANEHVEVAVATGMGEARNALVVRSADAVIAIGGEYGTLSEIALALKIGRPVVGISTWSLRRGDGASDTGIVLASSAAEAVSLALRLAGTDR